MVRATLHQAPFRAGQPVLMTNDRGSVQDGEGRVGAVADP